MTINVDFVISEEKLKELKEQKKTLLSSLKTLYQQALEKNPDFQNFKNKQQKEDKVVEELKQAFDNSESQELQFSKEELNKKLSAIIEGVVNDTLNLEEYYALNNKNERDSVALKKITIFQYVLNFSEILNKKSINEILEKENLSKKEEKELYEEYVFYAKFIEDFYQDRVKRKMFKNQSFFRFLNK